mgnify:CR=1 FL=1|tara:strand:- start:3541 stop:4407 length:867 start_codon:yes stop_codon:yes gene_type:complete
MDIKNSNLISIIVPCFNSGKTLGRTIDSIKNQTWINKEIILVNDGSTDEETLKILEEIKSKNIVKLISQKNSGLASARNKGAIKSKGNYLFFLDADDWIAPKTLEMMYFHLKQNKESGYIFSDIQLEGKRKGVLKKEFNLFEQLFLNQIPYSIFIPKKDFIKYGFYDENMKLGYEDWELNIRLAANDLFGKRLPVPLFHYDVQNTGMLLSKSIKNHIKIWNSIKKKNKSFYNIKRLFYTWWFWRKSPSSYPLLIFFVWYLMLLFLPGYLNLKIFLIFRNLSLLLRIFK